MKKSYLSLWLLLAAAFALFFILSCFDSPKLFGHEFKSTGMADVIMKKTSCPEITEKSPAASDEVVEPVPAFPVPVDTASQCILFIGDSMLAGLSPRLAAYTRASGHKQYSVIWYSSTSQIWAESDKLAKYIDNLKPTFIFICLGANELMVRDIKEKRRQFVEKIVSVIGDIPFLWIGPPNWRDDTGINELIEESVPAGSYFKSAGMKFDRKKDGAHPTSASASLWLDSVIRWMPLHSNHPIRFCDPSEEKARPERIFIHSPEER